MSKRTIFERLYKGQPFKPGYYSEQFKLGLKVRGSIMIDVVLMKKDNIDKDLKNNIDKDLKNNIDKDLNNIDINKNNIDKDLNNIYKDIPQKLISNITSKKVYTIATTILVPNHKKFYYFESFSTLKLTELYIIGPNYKNLIEFESLGTQLINLIDTKKDSDTIDFTEIYDEL